MSGSFYVRPVDPAVEKDVNRFFGKSFEATKEILFQKYSMMNRNLETMPSSRARQTEKLKTNGATITWGVHGGIQNA